MPSHLHADHNAAPPPDPGGVDALICRARGLRDELDAVRRESVPPDDDPGGRWQRALYELAAHHLDGLGRHLDQLREVLSETDGRSAGSAYGLAGSAAPGKDRPPEAADSRAPGRAGSAEWNLLTDQVTWSEEVYEIFGRSWQDGPLTLDEFPSWLFVDDQRVLTVMVTACLVDGVPIDGEFRIVRPDGQVRTVHMAGEPVPHTDGSIAAIWAVLRDVTELRLSQRTVRESREALQRRRRIERADRLLAAELREAILPSWHDCVRLPQDGEVPAVDLAGRCLPSGTAALSGGAWYDAMPLAEESVVMTVGDLTGHGPASAAGIAMLLGALRGMAIAGIKPRLMLPRLNEMLNRSAQPALADALYCHYDMRRRTLAWSQAGHPAPLLFRDGIGQALESPEGLLLGATSQARYGQRTERLRAGDTLVMYTEALVPWQAGTNADDGAHQLLRLGPRLTTARNAQECVRLVLEACGSVERRNDACVLVTRIL
jgi:PAS domain S-box-containing protein